MISIPTWTLQAFGACLLVLLSIVGFLIVKLINRYDTKLDQLERGFRSLCLTICELGEIICKGITTPECEQLRENLSCLRKDVIDS